MSLRSLGSLSATLFLALSSLASPDSGAPSAVPHALTTPIDYQSLNGLALLALDFHFAPQGLGSTLLEGTPDKALLPAKGLLEDWSDPSGLDKRWTRTGSFKAGAIRESADANWAGAASKHLLVAGDGPGRAISAPFALDGTAQAISYEVGSTTGSGPDYLVLQVQKNGKWQDQVVAKQTASVGVTKGRLAVAGITGLVRLVLATTKGGMAAGRLEFDAAGELLVGKNQGEGAKDGQSSTGETVAAVSVNNADLSNGAKLQPVSHPSPYTESSRFLQRVNAVLSTTITAPETKGGTLKCYAMIPPEIETQKLVSCDIVCPQFPELKAKRVDDVSDPSRSYLLIELPITSYTFKNPIAVDIHYTVDLYQVQIVPTDRPNVFEMPSDKALMADLNATPTLDYNSFSFRSYLSKHNLIKNQSENNIEFAFRAYQTITDDLLAHTRPNGHTETDKFKASIICLESSSDDGCGCCSVLFTSAMRANAVPSRLLVGRWAKTTEAGYAMFHVRSDFFEPSIGWVPVDQTFSLLEKRKNEPDYNRDFGLNNGDFLTFHLNSDVSPMNDNFRMPVHQFGIISYHGNSPYRPTYSEKWTVNKM